MAILSVRFEANGETKNTFKFLEQSGAEEPKIGTLYIQKKALNRKQPQRLSVTVETEE